MTPKKPTIECFKNSVISAYHNIWKYRKFHSILSLFAMLPFCLFGFFGAFRPFLEISSSLNSVPEHYLTAAAYLLISTFIWIIPCGVLWHRLFLLGPDSFLQNRFWSIFWRSFTMIGYSLIMIGMGVIITILLLYVAYFFLGHEGHMGLVNMVEHYGTTGEVEHPFIMALILLSVTYIVVRFSLAFSGRAVGCDTGFKNSWRLTRGKGYLMLIAHFLTSLPVSILILSLYFSISEYYSLSIYFYPITGIAIGYIFLFCTAPILMMPISMIASITSHFYHYCDASGCPQDDQNKEEITES